MTYNAELAIEKARSFLNVKWRHRGRSKFGIDCIGLIVISVKAGGIEMNDRVNYGRHPWKDGLRNELIAHFGKCVEGEYLPGDVALIKWQGAAEASHVGIIANSNYGLTLIHSFSQSSVVEHLIDDVWKSRIIEVYRP